MMPGYNLLLLGVFYIMVKRIQGTCVQSWLCTKPADYLEVSINGQSN